MNPAGRRPGPEVDALNSRQFTWLALVFGLGAIYGSLVPFHYRWLPLDEASARYIEVLLGPLRLSSGSDWMANVFLFIPLAFLCMAAFCVDRPWRESLAIALVIQPALMVLSASIEFAQLYFPPRVTSLDDVVAESFGAGIGILFWLSFGQEMVAWVRAVLSSLGREGWSGRVLPLYLFFLTLIHVMPIDLTISPAMIWRKYREGRIVLDPFATLMSGDPEATQKFLWDIVYYAPLGWLLAHLRAPRWRSWRFLPGVAGIAAVTAFGMETLQVFVWSRQSDLDDALVGTFCVIAGWAMTLAYLDLEGRVKRRGLVLSADALPVAVLAAWVALVFCVSWQPFAFTAAPDFLAERRLAFSWIPFADYRAGTEFKAFEQALHKTILFLPAGIILATMRGGLSRAVSRLLVVSLAFVLAGAVEIGQFFEPNHTASVTDVLIETFGAFVGCVLGERFASLPDPGMALEWRTHGFHG